MATSGPANAEESDEWSLSLSLAMGIDGFSGKASASSSQITGPPQPNPPNPVANDGPSTLISPIFGRSDVISGLLGVGFGVLTPQLTKGLGSPRVSLDFDVIGVVASETSLARDGRPDEFRFPILPTVSVVGDSLILGSGTSITAQQQSPLLVAALGVAWTFDLDGNRVRVKPSLVYSRSRLDVVGVSRRAVRLGSPNTSLDSYRLISLSDAQTEVYHGMGPGLELEYLLEPTLGPLSASLYVEGQAIRLFGDLETDLVGVDPNVPGEFVRWHYENDRWSFRALTGLRFHWSPRSEGTPRR
ncbi:MAG: hypothetical protein NXI30_05130 [bacterium]|nr:hypothetical protein [bacterium]